MGKITPIIDIKLEVQLQSLEQSFYNKINKQEY